MPAVCPTGGDGVGTVAVARLPAAKTTGARSGSTLARRPPNDQADAVDANVAALEVIGAIMLGLVAVAGRTRLGDRLPGSFGQAFVGFRGDGWPSGVQEDDDARWAWAASPRRPESIARRVVPGERATAEGMAPSLRAGPGDRPTPPTRPQR
jgi:hypothetical protein